MVEQFTTEKGIFYLILIEEKWTKDTSKVNLEIDLKLSRAGVSDKNIDVNIIGFVKDLSIEQWDSVLDNRDGKWRNYLYNESKEYEEYIYPDSIIASKSLLSKLQCYSYNPIDEIDDEVQDSIDYIFLREALEERVGNWILVKHKESETKSHDTIRVVDLIKALNDIVKNNPDALLYPVVYSHDDEGNTYQQVINLPTLCTVDSFDEYHVDLDFETENKNAVIIN